MNPAGPGQPLSFDEEQKWQSLLPELESAAALPGNRGRHARRERRGLPNWLTVPRTSLKEQLAEAKRQAAELAEQLAAERAVVSALLRCLG
jgi:hypothetical protein